MAPSSSTMERTKTRMRTTRTNELGGSERTKESTTPLGLSSTSNGCRRLSSMQASSCCCLPSSSLSQKQWPRRWGRRNSVLHWRFCVPLCLGIVLVYSSRRLVTVSFMVRVPPRQVVRQTIIRNVPSFPTIFSNHVTSKRTISPSLKDISDPVVVTQQSSSTTTNTTRSVRMPPPAQPQTSSSSSPQNKYYIPADELERLQQSIDLVSLVEAYDLPYFRRTGDGRASCLCPFHDDHNPSLKIDGHRGIFKCFSCGAGGNAIQFVRGYAKMHGTELSFLESVRLLDEIVTSSSSTSSSSSSSSSSLASSSPTMSSTLSVPLDVKVPMGARPTATAVANLRLAKPNIKSMSSPTTPVLTPAQEQRQRQRLLLANLHAAAFYEHSLFSLPSAGSARAHLRSRNINPHTVKAFSIGFAPESYFTSSETRSAAWGEGSLVNHLRDRGFTAQEIVDAGLAIKTKRARHSESQGQLLADYSTLMDRFRGRLVVPIFDARGNHVVGFGGRILESTDGSAGGNGFQAAKYLNSPESLVFQKKSLLFGHHMLDSLTRKSGQTASDGTPRFVLIVEGYMDAIALWQAGVKEAVATMGTAISFDQLAAAAKSARRLGGKIVLCLDNDEAGVAAVERLCKGQKPILYSVSESCNVEIHVASLAEGIKDPAQYLEENYGKDGVHHQFRQDISKSCMEWTEWYATQLVNNYNSSAVNGESGSFNDMFQKVASFAAIFKSIDVRSKIAQMIAPSLAKLMGSNGGNGIESSNTVCLQIESDLVERAAAIHAKGLPIHRSVEIIDETQLLDSGVGGRQTKISPSLEISGQFELLEGKKMEVKRMVVPPQIEASEELAAFPRRNTKRQRARLKRPDRSQPQQWKREKPMTRHISGLKSGTFDYQWLSGGRTDKASHLRYDALVERNPRKGDRNSTVPGSCIRFNSNPYHGKWTTNDSAVAGYYTSTAIPTKGFDVVRKGTGSLVGYNEEEMCTVIEDTLLRTLIRFKEARLSLSQSIRVSEASGSEYVVSWSSPAKAWLFRCLIDKKEDLSNHVVELGDLSDFRLDLANRPDVPTGAFGGMPNQNNGVSNELELDEAQEVLPEYLDEVIEPPSGTSTESSFMNESNGHVEMDASVSGVFEVPPTSLDEEWSDFAEMEGHKDPNADEPSVEASDPISLCDKMESIDADYVDDNLLIRGSLDHLFDNEDKDMLEILANYDSALDGVSSGGGISQDKAGWAVQNLYTILQSTSVMRRVRAGRLYMSGNNVDQLAGGPNANTSSSIVAFAGIHNDLELMKYCSSTSLTASNVSLRGDLHRIRNLIAATQRATERIYSLIDADFSDENARLKGYSWLGNMLRFNHRRMVEGWSELIELKEGFRSSEMDVDDVVKMMESEWSELCDQEEMWEWNKNVEMVHMSHVAESMTNRKGYGDSIHTDESEEDALDRISDEWGWVE